jgi:Ran-binding protein 3
VTPPQAGSPSPDVTSPQHEIKVRQISQGVEDISWKTKSQDDSIAEQAIIPTEPSPISSEPADVEVTPIAEPPAETTETDVAPVAPAPQDSTESLESDKGLKRKLSERASSAGPEIESKASTAETQKRPRDDADKDDNPREAKRPSPPPEKEKPTPPTPISKLVSQAP